PGVTDGRTPVILAVDDRVVATAVPAQHLGHRMTELGLRTPPRRRIADLLEDPHQPPVRCRLVRLPVLQGARGETVPLLTSQLPSQQLPVRVLRTTPVELERHTDLPDVVQARPERRQR